MEIGDRVIIDEEYHRKNYENWYLSDIGAIHYIEKFFDEKHVMLHEENGSILTPHVDISKLRLAPPQNLLNTIKSTYRAAMLKRFGGSVGILYNNVASEHKMIEYRKRINCEYWHQVYLKNKQL
jgi:hypothetical protein